MSIQAKPILKAISKGIGAKYLIKAFRPGNNKTSDTPSSYSPMGDAMRKAGWGNTDTTVPESFTPLGTAMQKAGWGTVGTTNPGTPGTATPRPASPATRTAGRIRGGAYSPLRNALAGAAGVPPPVPELAVDAVAPAPTKKAPVKTALRRMVGLAPAREVVQVAATLPVGPTGPAVALQSAAPVSRAFVPVMAATRQHNTVTDAQGRVRLQHGNKAVAQGGYGRFYRAVTPDGELRGLKEVNISGFKERGSYGLRPSAPRKVLQEVAIMKRLGMRVHGMYETPEGRMLIETDLYAGDLARAHALVPRHLRRSVARSTLMQQADQLAALHRAGWMHRDVKPENTLFAENGRVQVADPGLAIKIAPHVAHGASGTLDYMAPEVLKTINTGPVPYNEKCDTWSLGVAACESLVSTPWPFHAGKDQDDTFTEMRALLQYRENVMNNGEVDLQAVAAYKNIEGWGAYFHRMTLADKHLAKFILGRMLDPNPDTRASMQEVADAARDMSLPAKMLKPAENALAFRKIARTNNGYRQEVDTLKAQARNMVEA